MGFVIALFAFVFLIAGLTTQLVSFLTPNMFYNKLIPLDHQGLFHRCGLFTTVINALSNPYNTVNSLVNGPSSINGCYWWNRDLFNRDESKKYLPKVVN